MSFARASTSAGQVAGFSIPQRFADSTIVYRVAAARPPSVLPATRSEALLSISISAVVDEPRQRRPRSNRKRPTNFGASPQRATMASSTKEFPMAK